MSLLLAMEKNSGCNHSALKLNENIYLVLDGILKVIFFGALAVDRRLKCYTNSGAHKLLNGRDDRLGQTTKPGFRPHWYATRRVLYSYALLNQEHVSQMILSDLSISL